MAETDDETPRRALLKIWGPAILLTLVGFAVALYFMGAPPPKEVVIATGAPGGGYAAMGEVLASALRAAGIEPRIIETGGSE